jgi:hypothetical protein
MLLDNRTNGKVGEELRKHIEKGSQLSVVSGLFSIFGYSELKKELEKIDHFRFLLPQNSVELNNQNANDFFIKGLTGSEMERKFRNNLNITQIARECSIWLTKKAEIRTSATLIRKAFIILRNPMGRKQPYMVVLLFQRKALDSLLLILLT